MPPPRWRVGAPSRFGVSLARACRITSDRRCFVERPAHGFSSLGAMLLPGASGGVLRPQLSSSALRCGRHERGGGPQAVPVSRFRRSGVGARSRCRAAGPRRWAASRAARRASASAGITSRCSGTRAGVACATRLASHCRMCYLLVPGASPPWSAKLGSLESWARHENTVHLHMRLGRYGGPCNSEWNCAK